MQAPRTFPVERPILRLEALQWTPHPTSTRGSPSPHIGIGRKHSNTSSTSNGPAPTAFSRAAGHWLGLKRLAIFQQRQILEITPLLEVSWAEKGDDSASSVSVGDRRSSGLYWDGCPVAPSIDTNSVPPRSASSSLAASRERKLRSSTPSASGCSTSHVSPLQFSLATLHSVRTFHFVTPVTLTFSNHDGAELDSAAASTVDSLSAHRGAALVHIPETLSFRLYGSMGLIIKLKSGVQLYLVFKSSDLSHAVKTILEEEIAIHRQSVSPAPQGLLYSSTVPSLSATESQPRRYGSPSRAGSHTPGNHPNHTDQVPADATDKTVTDAPPGVTSALMCSGNGLFGSGRSGASPSGTSFGSSAGTGATRAGCSLYARPLSATERTPFKRVYLIPSKSCLPLSEYAGTTPPARQLVYLTRYRTVWQHKLARRLGRTSYPLVTLDLRGTMVDDSGVAESQVNTFCIQAVVEGEAKQSSLAPVGDLRMVNAVTTLRPSPRKQLPVLYFSARADSFGDKQQLIDWLAARGAQVIHKRCTGVGVSSVGCSRPKTASPPPRRGPVFIDASSSRDPSQPREMLQEEGSFGAVGDRRRLYGGLDDSAVYSPASPRMTGAASTRPTAAEGRGTVPSRYAAAASSFAERHTTEPDQTFDLPDHSVRVDATEVSSPTSDTRRSRLVHHREKAGAVLELETPQEVTSTAVPSSAARAPETLVSPGGAEKEVGGETAPYATADEVTYNTFLSPNEWGGSEAPSNLQTAREADVNPSTYSERPVPHAVVVTVSPGAAVAVEGGGSASHVVSSTFRNNHNVGLQSTPGPSTASSVAKDTAEMFQLQVQQQPSWASHSADRPRHPQPSEHDEISNGDATTSHRVETVPPQRSGTEPPNSETDDAQEPDGAAVSCPSSSSSSSIYCSPDIIEERQRSVASLPGSAFREGSRPGGSSSREVHRQQSPPRFTLNGSDGSPAGSRSGNSVQQVPSATIATGSLLLTREQDIPHDASRSAARDDDIADTSLERRAPPVSVSFNAVGSSRPHNESTANNKSPALRSFPTDSEADSCQEDYHKIEQRRLPASAPVRSAPLAPPPISPGSPRAAESPSDDSGEVDGFEQPDCMTHPHHSAGPQHRVPAASRQFILSPTPMEFPRETAGREGDESTTTHDDDELRRPPIPASSYANWRDAVDVPQPSSHVDPLAAPLQQSYTPNRSAIRDRTPNPTQEDDTAYRSSPSSAVRSSRISPPPSAERRRKEFVNSLKSLHVEY